MGRSSITGGGVGMGAFPQPAHGLHGQPPGAELWSKARALSAAAIGRHKLQALRPGHPTRFAGLRADAMRVRRQEYTRLLPPDAQGVRAKSSKPGGLMSRSGCSLCPLIAAAGRALTLPQSSVPGGRPCRPCTGCGILCNTRDTSAPLQYSSSLYNARCCT
jgi:hypothetical protein